MLRVSGVSISLSFFFLSSNCKDFIDLAGIQVLVMRIIDHHDRSMVAGAEAHIRQQSKTAVGTGLARPDAQARRRCSRRCS